MSTAEIVPINTAAEVQLAGKVSEWVTRARALRVIDQQTYDAACEELLANKALQKEVIAHHAPIKAASWAAHQVNLAQEKKLLDPLQQGESIVKPKLATYQAEQKRIADEARRKAEETERQRLLEEREAEIEQAESEGADVEEIAAIAEAPLPAPVVKVEPTFQRAAGVTTATVWKARVTAIQSIVKAATAGNSAAMSILQVNEVALNGLARSTRGTLQIPGVEFYSEDQVRAGRR